MNLQKWSLIPQGSTENMKAAIRMPTDERNKHHRRAKWLAGISLLLMVTIFAAPVGIPLFLWGLHEANKAEAKRAA